ncbi:hypothetical protein CC86DRAFT_373258 [Ophiobolus disseminans]|uniref:Basic proline-rich protein n=1 Tax=Ophiobolus disseminans TaxID=1469910 RepID=A0A6A6ZLX1_9PLEO|nr:hypothetical protein CC86DRAFT_373258 [Ophiobolus disseminans]
MTPNVSLPPRARDDSQHADLVQRLNAMTTSTSTSHLGPTPVRSPSKTPTYPVDIQEATPEPSAYSSKQASSFMEDTDGMGEVNALARQLSNTSDDSFTSRRPTTPRAQTDPYAASDASALYRPQQQRNRSPYSRSHLRSKSSSGSLSAPPMTRAHSLPTVMHPTGQLTLSPSPTARPSSPLRSPKRTRSPRGLEPRPLPAGPQERYGSGIRPASLGSFEGSPSVCDISEDAELELTPRASPGVASLYSSTGSLSRRRRPASPLHNVTLPFGVPPTSTPTVSTPTSGASSPLFAPARFTEQYPSSLASSSVPSTPTSMRSRSPSISSLETIEDSPDAEEEAIEAERIAKLKAAADREDGGDQRRSSLDVPERGRTFGFGKRDSRKRWSVCGAERRGDLDLETIWED